MLFHAKTGLPLQSSPVSSNARAEWLIICVDGSPDGQLLVIPMSFNVSTLCFKGTNQKEDI